GAPALDAGNEVRDTGIALPPVLVRAFQRAEAREESRPRRIADIPQLLPCVAERTQEIELGRVAARQLLAGADAHHLRAAGFAQAFLAGDMREQARCARVGDVEYRRAVEFGVTAYRVDRPGRAFGAAMMADVENPAAVLFAYEWLVGAP